MENIIIVGAGLVGSLLSVFLARVGYKVNVYDRNLDPRQINLQSGRSINITLSERGFCALDTVGVGDKVRELCIPVYGRIMHAQDGELTYQPYGNNKEAIYSIGRDDLSKALINFAQKHDNIEFYFNQKCIDIDLPTATLKFQDLHTEEITQVEADRIFAADGAYSPVRYKMQRLKRFNYSQEYLNQGYKEIIIPAGSDGNWALEKNAIHIWPRDNFMLIGFPNLDKSFTLSLHLPYEGEISHNSTASPDALQNLFETYFPDIWSLVYPNLGDYAKKPVEAMITIKCFPWSYQDKVLLIGDSCHAVVPSYGQGANAGFENCRLLTQCIEQHLGDWQTAFKEYETLRKPEMDMLANLCLEHFTVLRKVVGDRNFIERSKIERKLQEMNSEYASLYYNISFTSMSYSEALKIEKNHQEIISEFAQKNLKSEVSV
ncbi:MAG: FAD-dependent monooxygenase [Fischerella sp. CENA71]|nr:FAD-dependent monooxygenase [Fischerella sp. CENA71]